MALKIELRSSRLRALIPADADLELLATGFDFVEGPVWHAKDEYLLFSDVPQDVILRWDSAGVSEWRRPSHKANGLTRDIEGRLVACEHSTSSVTRTEHDGSITTITCRAMDKELNSPNDVVIRSDGTIYFTDPPAGRTSERWRLVRPRQLEFQPVCMVPSAGGEAVVVADDFAFPNGLCFSPDERILYVNDSMEMHVRAFNVRDNGTLTNGSVFISQQATGRSNVGVPDGMKTDQRGNVWATGPSGIWIITPGAEVLGIVNIPETVTNLNWGAPDWRTLYITATHSLYRLRTKVRGAHTIYMDRA